MLFRSAIAQVRKSTFKKGPGLAAPDSCKEGFALPVACQSDPGGGDEEGKLNLARPFDKSILIAGSGSSPVNKQPPLIIVEGRITSLQTCDGGGAKPGMLDQARSEN